MVMVHMHGARNTKLQLSQWLTLHGDTSICILYNFRRKPGNSSQGFLYLLVNPDPQPLIEEIFGHNRLRF